MICGQRTLRDARQLRHTHTNVRGSTGVSPYSSNASCQWRSMSAAKQDMGRLQPRRAVKSTHPLASPPSLLAPTVMRMNICHGYSLTRPTGLVTLAITLLGTRLPPPRRAALSYECFFGTANVAQRCPRWIRRKTHNVSVGI